MHHVTQAQWNMNTTYRLTFALEKIILNALCFGRIATTVPH
jgi:hypothetical protein